MRGNWEAVSLFMKGLSLYQAGRNREALDAYAEATESDSTFAEPWNARCYTQGVEGRYRDALDAYDKALDLDPPLVYAWNGKGYMLAAEGRHTEALIAYRRAIELDA